VRQPDGQRGIVVYLSEQRDEPMMSAQVAEAPPRAMQRYQLESGLGRLTPAERAAHERDHKSLVDAVASGRITAEPDL
jgi:hypothetical protein